MCLIVSFSKGKLELKRCSILTFPLRIKPVAKDPWWKALRGEGTDPGIVPFSGIWCRLTQVTLELVDALTMLRINPLLVSISKIKRGHQYEKFHYYKNVRIHHAIYLNLGGADISKLQIEFTIFDKKVVHAYILCWTKYFKFLAALCGCFQRKTFLKSKE